MLLVGKELQKTNQDAFRVEKVVKKIGNNRLNGMAILVLLTVGVTKMIYDKWANIFQDQNLQEEQWKVN